MTKSIRTVKGVLDHKLLRRGEEKSTVAILDSNEREKRGVRPTKDCGAKDGRVSWLGKGAWISRLGCRGASPRGDFPVTMKKNNWKGEARRTHRPIG